MALEDDDVFGAPVRKPSSSPHQIGQTLDDLSVQELDERIAALQAEVRRLEDMRARKHASLSAAAAFFKPGSP
ncbi:DUF1192 domain-containing protein [Methylocapsa palsarum]|uniref:Uncharacterized small protein, DUF1192 family n=1 Tax=Methylocapsa palsarum TaxID=1612308 RepID=A0A1I3XWR9_9HYPH|nr:DUF1192 domain-containing protein [Methylocapsa palsarum]SFK23436.1 Uncharacterized small protein, DUF1192 family [Methylocapsa palsarum]